jgi:RNA polymerase sigma-70 factor, ECF subfamily
LPEKQHLVFILRDIEGMESSEVEQVLGMTEESVKSNLCFARKVIRERLVKIMTYERRVK